LKHETVGGRENFPRRALRFSSQKETGRAKATERERYKLGKKELSWGRDWSRGVLFKGVVQRKLRYPSEIILGLILYLPKTHTSFSSMSLKFSF